MGTEDGARAESLLWRLFGRGGRIAAGGYQQQLPLRQLRGGRLRSGGWLQPLAFLAAGVLIGLYGGAVLQLGLHHGSSSDDGSGALLSRWRELGASKQEQAAAAQAMCPPCAAADDDDPKGKAAPAPAEQGGAIPLGKELKDKWGLDALGTVDAHQAFEAFWPFLPPTIEDSLYPRALVLSTPGSKMTVHSPAGPGQPIDLDDLKTCKEVDVITLGQGRCYVATSAKVQYPSFFVNRYKHRGEELGWRLVPRIEKEGSTPPITMNQKKHENFLVALFNNYTDLEKAASALLEKIAGKEKRVLVMALNEGDTDLLVNFVCSARAAQIPLDNTVVFAADQATVDTAEALGLASFTHPAFGKLPSAHSHHYGDAGFLAIMWLKIVSVWLPLRLGYDVFFQDADVVWLKSPWDAFKDPDIDGWFMDDGARSERFAPLYANSGLYYLRSNPMVQHFMQSVLFSYDMVIQYASHQTLFIQALSEHIARNGLRVRILPYADFPGGQVFHHKKELMNKISTREYLPYTFHMCWTQTKTDKLRYLRNASLWFVDDACSNGSAMAVETIRSKKVGIGACCVDPMAGVATARLR